MEASSVSIVVRLLKTSTSLLCLQISFGSNVKMWCADDDLDEDEAYGLQSNASEADDADELPVVPMPQFAKESRMLLKGVLKDCVELRKALDSGWDLFTPCCQQAYQASLRLLIVNVPCSCCWDHCCFLRSAMPAAGFAPLQADVILMGMLCG